MTDKKKYAFPVFELVGPPCKDPDCNGTLIDCCNWHTNLFYRRCSVCKKEFEHMDAKKKLDQAVDIIEKIMNKI